MAKKQADTVDLNAERRKRIKWLTTWLVSLYVQLRDCVNERAHLRQFYLGRIEQAEEELSYLKGLLDG
jgi:hypothetical protein